MDVAQEVIINEEDPFEDGKTPPPLGSKMSILKISIGIAMEITLAKNLQRLTDIKKGCQELVSTVKFLLKMQRFQMGQPMRRDDGDRGRDEPKADDPDISRVRCLTPLTDESEQGIAIASYGMSMATGSLIEIGEAVGVIAAQSIGDPVLS